MGKKLSIVIPVYFNAENLAVLFSEIKSGVIEKINADVEVIFVDDGSGDDSWEKLYELAAHHPEVKAVRLSRNFGSHAAILCGLANATGDCAVVKTADSQEPCEMIPEMFDKWEKGANVVLAVREGRDDSKGDSAFANFYYWFIAKTALPTMPKGGFDIYLIDRKVMKVLELMDEKNSALTGQILWSGFKTEKIFYKRLARKTGKSRWTFRKKIGLFMNSIFSFTSLPITIVSVLGGVSILGAFIWAIIAFISRAHGNIVIEGWTASFIFSLFSFGVLMLTLGLLGGYLWRTFDASRNRPIYIIEETTEKNNGDS